MANFRVLAWLVIMAFSMIGAKWFGPEYWQYSWDLAERYGRSIGIAP